MPIHERNAGTVGELRAKSLCHMMTEKDTIPEGLTYEADRSTRDGRYLNDVRDQEEFTAWVENQKAFRVELRKCRDALQQAYDKAVTPSAMSFMEEYLRSVCMIDEGLAGMMRAMAAAEETP